MAVRGKKGRYSVEFELKGHRIFRRLPLGATKAQAQELETRLRTDIINQSVLGKRPNVPLDYAIKCWLEEEVTGRKSERETRSKAGLVMASIGSSHGGCSCGEVAAVAGGIANATATGLATSTINRRLCILKAVAKFAWRKGWTAENLSGKIRLLPENNARHVYLSPGQIKNLLRATPKRSRAYVALAVFTGMRQAEILALAPDDITAQGIRVKDRKGGVQTIIPIVEGANRFLSQLPFTLHKRTYYADFEKARSKIKMPHLRYHDLRHTTASLLINSGVDIYTVGRILGHKSAQTTQRYAHLSLEKMREAMDKAFPKKRKAHRKPIKGL